MVATQVSVDFELAIHNACKTVLGDDIIINGCLTHLFSNVLKRVQTSGYATMYTDKDDPSFRDFVAKIDALAFLPPEDLHEAVQILHEESPCEAATEILQYFDETYISGTFRELRRRQQQQANPDEVIMRFRRQPAKFPPEKWSAYQRTLDGVDRTNNASEGWNRGYAELVGVKRPTVWRSIETLQLAEVKVHAVLVQHLAGRRIQPTHPKKPEYVKLNDRLTRLCAAYGETDITTFLRRVSRNLRHSRRCKCDRL